MFDTLPSALLTLFLALCVLWLIVQALRKLFRSRKRREAPSDTILDPRPGYPEPVVSSAPRSVPTIPDAADVLALKAAIDNLTRQVAALEQRLASGPALSQPTQTPSVAPSVEPVPELPPATPEHRI